MREIRGAAPRAPRVIGVSASAVLTALATVGGEGLASAAGPLGTDGAAIRTSSYGVDLAQTPVLAGSRVTGLAGAYVALAEGTDGDIQTPVSPAVRTSYALDHFDYELGLGVMLPASLANTDFFNTGRDKTRLSDDNQQSFVFITPAANLVWGVFGLGATAEIQNYTIARSKDSAGATADQIAAQFTVWHLQAARTFGRGRLAVGGGARIISLDVVDQSPAGNRDLFSTVGAGIELGVLLMPQNEPFRIGAAFRSAVSTVPDSKSQLAPNAAGDRIVGDSADPANAIWLPSHAEVPWDLNVGFAVQIGPRPFNVAFRDPKLVVDEAELLNIPRSHERAALRNSEKQGATATRERSAAVDATLDAEDALDELHVQRLAKEARAELRRREAARARGYFLISTSLVLTGAVADAVGVESFLQRVVAHSGRHLGYSPRLGLETEPIPRWLKVRAGTYGEPSRFATSGNRLHGTFGFDVKLFPWEVFGLFDEGTTWRASAVVDGAPRYFGWGIGIGVWH